MKGSTAVLCSIGTFVAMIQPCPAPPLAIAGIGVALGAGAATAGAAAAGIGRGQKRDAADALPLSICVADAVGGGSPQFEHGPSGSIFLHGLPQSCIDEVHMYNQHPQINDFNAVQGQTTAINGTSVMLHNLPPHVAAAMSDLKNHFPAAAPAPPLRRSVKFGQK